MSAAFSQLHRLDLTMEANNMNPGQTAPPKEQSDLGPYCLQYWHCLTKRLLKHSADNKADDFKS